MEISGLAKLVIYLFGIYNLILGLIAVVFPSLGAAFYSVNTITNEWIALSRWTGALAIAIAYGAFTVVKTKDGRIINIIIISAIASLVASILNIIKGNAAWANVIVDLTAQIAVLLALVFAGRKDEITPTMKKLSH